MAAVGGGAVGGGDRHRLAAGAICQGSKALLQLGFGHADYFHANSVIHSKSTPNPVPKQLGGAADCSCLVICPVFVARDLSGLRTARKGGGRWARRRCCKGYGRCGSKRCSLGMSGVS